MRRKDVTKPEPSTRTAARAPRQARGRERREQLLDAAAALIAES
ncbi:TetR/AcrR family transcriptional regulator, partial [Neisseria gonorrhoeae]